MLKMIAATTSIIIDQYFIAKSYTNSTSKLLVVMPDWIL